MTSIYRYWTSVAGNGKPSRKGCSTAEVTYHFHACEDYCGSEVYGRDRKTLNAAINDAKRYYRKHPDAFFSIYANAILTDYFDDGTQVRTPTEDCARIGTLDADGEYFALCEPVDWL